MTAIVSMGGMGKSSLACAVAVACTRQDTSAPSPESGTVPHFDVAVWVSDKDRPGSTNLSITLNEIARVLDYPGLMSLPFAEKRRAIEDLLRNQPVLVVLDNAETITDEALLEWVNVIPAPSKALVTTRALPPAELNYHLVELAPMTAREARELIAERLRHGGWQTRMEQLPALLPIADAAGGNPKAIIIALGLIQRRNRPVVEVIDALNSADVGDLFEDLFTRLWELLDGQAQRALLTVALFPTSVAEEALRYIADLSQATLRRVTGQLVELSLLDAEQDDPHLLPRYTMHALVRAFVVARLAEHSEQAIRLRSRWLGWCLDLSEETGFVWFDLSRLDKLDTEHETIQTALEWAVNRGYDKETLALAEGVRYYYNVRGLWDNQRMKNYIYRIEASTRLGDTSQHVLALTQLAEVLSKQSTLAQAAGWLAQAEEVSRDAALDTDARFELAHARALLAHAHGHMAVAEQHWRELLPFSATLDPQKHIINRRWLATALLEQGRDDEAAALYRESLRDARNANDTRSVTGNTLKLAAIGLGRNELDEATRLLAECHSVASRHDDRRRLAECHYLLAQLASKRGDGETARVERERAIDLFGRMGMRREAEAMREIGS